VGKRLDRHPQLVVLLLEQRHICAPLFLIRCRGPREPVAARERESPAPVAAQSPARGVFPIRGMDH